MDYFQKSQHEIEQHKLRLRQRLQQVSLEVSRLEQESNDVKRQLRALDQMYAGTEMGIGRLDSAMKTSPGLTEYVRSLMANSEVPLTAKQIHDSCVSAGITGKSRRNQLIAVHTVLKRLNLTVRTAYLDGRPTKQYLPRPSLMSNPKTQWRQ
jgi:hypothetical protein